MAEIIVALDHSTGEEALALVDVLGSDGNFYKIGPGLFSREGPKMVESLIKREKKVFLDLKLHDIPNTVAGSVIAVRELGVDFLTIHTMGGIPMMEAAAEAAGDALTLLGVTVLTSMAVSDIEVVWDRKSVSLLDESVRLTRIAKEAGLDGDDCDDQIRFATPAYASESGSDYLVVGRSITRALDPVTAFSLVYNQAKRP